MLLALYKHERVLLRLGAARILVGVKERPMTLSPSPLIFRIIANFWQYSHLIIFPIALNLVFVLKNIGLSLLGCKESFESNWGKADSSNPIANISSRISDCKAALRQWSKNEIPNLSESLKAKQRKLDQMQYKEIHPHGVECFKKLEKEVAVLLEQEEK